MTDIAQLAYAVDSSGLQRGTQQLDKHTVAAQKTETATAKLDRQVQGLAMSQKQLLQAQRQLPMQFTDIATSLASGQRPLQVFLQQGGQLKDVFGGVGPALRASAGYIMGLVNPLTLVAGAIGVVVVAYSQFTDRQNAIDQSLIRTGKYTEEYARQLRDLSNELDSVAGVTAGSAAKAIAEVAATGSFTKDQLELVARAAETWRAATGDAIEETVKDFEKLKGDPVKAALAMNREYGNLTKTVLDQIVALKDQGREIEATELLFRTLANTLQSRAPQMRESVDDVTAGFRFLKEGAKEAWDEVVEGVGRGISAYRRWLAESGRLPAAMLDDVGQVEERIRKLSQMRFGTGLVDQVRQFAFGDSIEAELKKAVARRNELLKPPAGSEAAVDQDEVERAMKAQEEWDRERLSHLSKAEKLEQDIADIRKKGLAAGKSEADIEKSIADARARYQDSISKGRKGTDPTDALVKRLREQIALNEEQLQSEDKLTATERMLVQVRTELERIGAKGSAANKKLIAELVEQAKTTGIAVEATERQRKAEESLARLRERTGLAEQNQRRANEVDLVGMSAGGEATDMLRRQLDLHRWYEDQVSDLNKQAARERRDVTLGEEQELKDSLQRQLDEERRYQEQRQLLMGDWKAGYQRAFEDYLTAASDVNGQTYEIFSNAFSGLEDLTVDFFSKGTADWKGYLDSINEQIMRFFVRQKLSELMEKFLPGAAKDDQASGLSKAAGELAASAAPLLGAAAALSASATALAAAGLASGVGGSTGFGSSGGFDAGTAVDLIGLAFGGGRENGGGVSGDEFYRVGERNKPELLNLGNGRQYLIPGDQGSVEPMSRPQATPMHVTQQFYSQGQIDPRSASQMQVEAAQKLRIAAARNG